MQRKRQVPYQIAFPSKATLTGRQWLPTPPASQAPTAMRTWKGQGRVADVDR